MLLLCQFLIILDTTGFNVALTAISRDFQVPASQAGVVNLGFFVTVAIMIPLSGWLGERFGTVRILIFGLGMIMLGSLICANGISLSMVVAGRIVQGFGGGGLVPLAASLMYRNFEPLHRLRIATLISMPISLAPALGPLVGGFFVDHLSWRWAFLLNLPIAAAAIVVGFVFASEAAERSRRPLDVRGALLTAVGFGAIVFGLDRVATSSQLVVGAAGIAVGVVALTVLLPLERRLGERAFLDLRLFQHRTFAKTTSIEGVHSIGFMGFGLAGPMLLQTQLGLTAFQAGLVGAVNALGPFVSSRFARQLIMRVRPRAALAMSQSGVILSFAIVVAGYALPAVWLIAIGTFVLGLSTFLTVATCQTVGFAVIPQVNLGDATALEGSSRQLGGALGITAVSAALAVAASAHAPVVGTAAVVFGTIAVFHVVALAIVASPGRLPLPVQRETAGAQPAEA